VSQSWRMLLLVAALPLLASCGIFGDKDDDELEPKELISFSQTLKVKRLWSAKVSGDAAFLRVALRPVGDGTRIYAAGYGGVVAAPVFREVITNALRILDVPPDDLPSLAQTREEGA